MHIVNMAQWIGTGGGAQRAITPSIHDRYMYMYNIRVIVCTMSDGQPRTIQRKLDSFFFADAQWERQW